MIPCSRFPKACRTKCRKTIMQNGLQINERNQQKKISSSKRLPVDDHLDHFTNFFDAIRTGKKVVEDAEFGFRAAAPALSCNESYFSKKIVKWDPVNMKLKS